MRALPILIALSLSACGVVNPGDMKQAEGLCADHQGVAYVFAHILTISGTLEVSCVDSFHAEVHGGKHE